MKRQPPEHFPSKDINTWLKRIRQGSKPSFTYIHQRIPSKPTEYKLISMKKVPDSVNLLHSVTYIIYYKFPAKLLNIHLKSVEMAGYRFTASLASYFLYRLITDTK